jgi:hypothetical protein
VPRPFTEDAVKPQANKQGDKREDDNGSQ